MPRDETPIGISEQIAILLDYGLNANGNTPGLREVAEDCGISDQTLVNLVQGKATNPRLKTLLALCRYYRISLDYFAAESQAACLAYLNTYRLKNAAPLLSEISQATARLSPKGQRNILAMLDWMEAAKQAEA